MNKMEEVEKIKSKKNSLRILVETILFYSLFGISSILPYKVYFNEIGEAIRNEIGFGTYELMFLFVFSIITTISVFTFNKLIVLVTVIISFFFVFIGLLFNTVFSNMYVPYGPISPETKFGYFVTLTLVIIYLLRTLYWRTKFNEIEVNQFLTYIPKLIIFLIPMYFIYQTKKTYNEPIRRSLSYSEKDSKFLRSENWDYTEEYNAYITKYFSGKKIKPEDTKYKNSSKYRLDSVSVIIFDGNSEVEKQFSKKIKNNQFDIDEILNE